MCDVTISDIFGRCAEQLRAYGLKYCFRILALHQTYVYFPISNKKQQLTDKTAGIQQYYAAFLTKRDRQVCPFTVFCRHQVVKHPQCNTHRGVETGINRREDDSNTLPGNSRERATTLPHDISERKCDTPASADPAARSSFKAA